MKETTTYNIKTLDESVVKHEGVVSKISNGIITVSLRGNLHCDACNAKSACGVSDSNSKEIEVIDATESIELNENVEVFLKKGLGLKAVFWAYVFPFILLLTVLLIALSLYPEWLAGLLAVGILIPYYLTLYVLRDSFKNTFKVSILKTT